LQYNNTLYAPNADRLEVAREEADQSFRLAHELMLRHLDEGLSAFVV